ncbi:MAG: AroM family protein [Candidatus Rokubacteria bacterium]|nr:AroM family protein [Candidatus Rokubacteria bacterium]
MGQRLGIVTIGQAPRTDVVPDMAEILGPGVEVLERGALDGLDIRAITALAPGPDDEILVTRLRGGSSVFVAHRHIVPRVQACLADLDRTRVAMSVLLCTGVFPGLASAAPLLHPDRLLLGVLRALSWSGRLGVLTPSAAHVPQTLARWRGYGFDPVVAVGSPYGEETPSALGLVVEAFGAGEAGLVVLDCMGYRRKVKDELRALLGVPVLQANLLLARVVAELLA